MSDFSEPFDAILRRNIVAVTEAFIAHTGKPVTSFYREHFADSALYARLRSGEASFRVATYDDLMAHFSFSWPTDLAWPAGVPRPAPKKAEPSRRPRKAKETADG